MKTLLPYSYYDICPSLRGELEEAFGLYFQKELLDFYCLGLYDRDHVALLEAEEEARLFIVDYLTERLMDEF